MAWSGFPRIPSPSSPEAQGHFLSRPSPDLSFKDAGALHPAGAPTHCVGESNWKRCSRWFLIRKEPEEPHQSLSRESGFLGINFLAVLLKVQTTEGFNGLLGQHSAQRKIRCLQRMGTPVDSTLGGSTQQHARCTCRTIRYEKIHQFQKRL